MPISSDSAPGERERNPAVLRLTGVAAGYGGAAIVSGVSISVGPGEVVSVIGPNGAGKSTLLKAVTGRLPVMAGTVTFKDRDVTNWRGHLLARMGLGFVPQTKDVFDTLTVESFTHPGYAAVRAAIEAAGGTSTGVTGAEWLEAVRAQTTSSLTAGLISELGVEAIQVDDEKLPRYIGGVLARLQEVWMGRQIAEVKSKLQRMSPIEQGDEYHALFGDLVAMEAYRRSLLEQASGDDLTV